MQVHGSGFHDSSFFVLMFVFCLSLFVSNNAGTRKWIPCFDIFRVNVRFLSFSFCRKYCRYTEGDFHYLKYAKITALPRQFSLGTGPSSAPVRPMPSLGATASDTAFRYSLDERLRILQQDAEKNFPPIQADFPHPLASQSRPAASPERSPRAGARAGSRGSTQEGTLAVSSAAYEQGGGLGGGVGGGGVSRIRLSPSPPRCQRGDRWRRTPSASPSPPGEPVHRQVNVEVHYQQEGEAQVSSSSSSSVRLPKPFDCYACVYSLCWGIKCQKLKSWRFFLTSILTVVFVVVCFVWVLCLFFCFVLFLLFFCVFFVFVLFLFFYIKVRSIESRVIVGPESCRFPRLCVDFSA